MTWQTCGNDLDADGYVLQVDGYWDYTHPHVGLGLSGKVILTGIGEGEHTLTLRGVAPNCTDERLEDRPVTVVADSVVTVEFQIVRRTR